MSIEVDMASQTYLYNSKKFGISAENLEKMMNNDCSSLSATAGVLLFGHIIWIILVRIIKTQ